MPADEWRRQYRRNCGEAGGGLTAGNYRKMNKEKITWGLIFLFTGVILLLSNIDVIRFHWGTVFRFWPVLLIVLGVNLMVPRHGTGNVISLVTTVLVLLFLVSQGLNPPDITADRERRSNRMNRPE